MRRRVVVTGLGVVAPNANTVDEFEAALRDRRSGIRHFTKLAELGFGCQVGGAPEGVDAIARSYFDDEERMAMNGNMTFAAIAAVDAWTSAGLERPELGDDRVDWDAGAIIGTGIGGIDTVGGKVVPLTDSGKVRRLGSTAVEQIMGSNVSAKVGGLFSLGNQVTTNSSACTTGTEAISNAFERVRAGRAERMLAGGSEADCHYIWAGFDAMRVTARGFNDDPERASRPMSASACGFVPGAGAGVLLLESLESALERGAPILAEIVGAAVNCGGQRGGGSMTAPNPTGVRRCIRAALADAELLGASVDLINGHLTATFADPREIENWAAALGVTAERMPLVTATKSLIGHALGAAGAIESVASVLMLHRGFVHGAANAEDLHPDIRPYARSIPEQTIDRTDLDVVAKAGFGFGDVNSCVIFRRYRSDPTTEPATEPTTVTAGTPKRRPANRDQGATP